jgi:hypothetical protein
LEGRPAAKAVANPTALAAMIRGAVFIAAKYQHAKSPKQIIFLKA